MVPNELVHAQEDARLKSLHSLQVLETPIEERFERITRVVAKFFDVPICAIACVDIHRQWFKSIQGLNVSETERCVSFCQHTVHRDEVVVVNDARFDSRFDTNPLVTDSPGIVFYAGAPIYSKDDLPVASLCIIDTQPRSLSQGDIETLKDYAKMVETQLRLSPASTIEQNLIAQIGESWRGSLIDPLTRLWNHEGLTTLLGAALVTKLQSNSEMIVGLIDLKNMGQINTTLGHVAGDELIRLVSKRLLSSFEDGHILGRLAGDTFMFIMNSPSTTSQWSSDLNQVQRLLNQYQVLGITDRTTLGATIVAARVPAGWTGSMETLLEHIDETMYQSKSDERTNPTYIDAITLKNAVDTEHRAA